MAKFGLEVPDESEAPGGQTAADSVHAALLADSTAPRTPSDQLLAAAQTAFPKDRKAISRISAAMDLLKQRAHNQGLPNSEVDETFKQVTRLLSDSGNSPLSKSARDRIAEQVLEQAADPTIVHNGFHKTCGLADIEKRTYYRHPAAAARLVADVSLSGSYVTKTGIHIDLTNESLQPDPEASLLGAQTDKRSYASQLFQIAAANLNYNRGDTTFEGAPVARGQLFYSQVPNPLPGQQGERLCMWKDPHNHSKGYNVVGSSAAIEVADLEPLSNQISGVSEHGFVIAHQSIPGANALKTSSGQQLEQQLKQVFESNNSPAIVVVYATHQPFLGNEYASHTAGSNPRHSVLAVELNADTARLDDPSGNATNKWIGFNLLFDTMVKQ